MNTINMDYNIAEEAFFFVRQTCSGSGVVSGVTRVMLKSISLHF